jgi:predicted transcriptional regulator of viral defense system
MENFWANERFRSIVARQHGRITWAQLAALGVSRSTVSQWSAAGYLTRVLPKVYAVGHTAPSREARLWEAVLYAGPGAVLSHESAANWLGLIRYPPAVVHVSTPRAKIRSVAGLIRVDAERRVERIIHDRMPVTTIPQTLLDLARVEPELVPRALAALDFRRELDVDELLAVCGRGRLGSRELRAALEKHQPALAQTNGELEERFLRWCERWKVPLPEFNARLHGLIVDAYWPRYGLVVELDGYANHSSPAQLRRDRERELSLRAHGLRVVRYDWELLHRQPEKMHADLMSQLEGGA